MKTIHVLIATAALAIAPLAAHAQSAPTTTTGATDATGTPETTDSATATTTTDPTGSDVGSTGTGTGTNSATSTAAPTGTSDIGSTGTGTGTNDIGSTGTGTGTNDIGSTGTGTGTFQSAAPPYVPTVTLAAKAASLRTPGTVQVQVTLGADASLDPPQARDVSVPLASSSAACTVPASATVAWTSAAGGSATVDVTCKKAGGQAVTISSGTASTSFTIK